MCLTIMYMRYIYVCGFVAIAIVKGDFSVGNREIAVHVCVLLSDFDE